MKSKAFLKSTKLPPAPAPTRAVETKEKAPVATAITALQRKRAAAASLKVRSGTWSYDDEKKLKELFRKGYTREEITGQFPMRTYAAVCSKIRRMKKRGQIW